MAERRKNKKKKEIDSKDLDNTPTKDEYAIAKYLKQKLPEKKTTLLGHKVEYFIASKAVDCLLDSPWANESKKLEVYFPTRESVIDYMAKLLDHKFFHRAKKIIVQKEPKKKKKDEEGSSDVNKEGKKTKSKLEGEEKKEKTDVTSKEKDSKKSKGKQESEKKEDKTDEKKDIEASEKKKEKKKIKLDMHLDQIFIDSNEPYVWIYDPIPMRTWIFGTLMVIAAVLICLFPLWPQTIRHYIYYLSVAAAFFLVFIIGLAVLRLVVFVLIWVLTLGKHHLWLLPNLTEDVGFFESFWPLYKYQYKGTKDKKDQTDEKVGHKDSKENEVKEGNKSDESSSDQEQKEVDQNPSESEHESDGEGEKQKAENGFEFLEVEEMDSSFSDDRKTK